jgi:uncharacterized heparinase superfamily protein
MHFRSYLRQLRTHPPAILWQKTKRQLRRRWRAQSDRWRVRWASPVLSDDALLAALGGRFATVQDYLRHMAVRSTPQFFVDPSRREEVAAVLRKLCPTSEAQTRKAADATCAHRFDLLGSGPTALGAQIDWHTDFKSGHRWNPRTYYSDIRAAPYPGGYDLKVPWELSRCQHFAWLGQAYWFCGDERYAQEYVDQVTDWIRQNPPQLGVNWACAMDVAIRAVNWLWGYYLLQSSPAFSNSFRLALFKSLLQHGRHIFANLEFSETLTSNHYLSDIVGLIYLGILLPEFEEAREWRRFGLQELEQEMFKQVYPDGVDFEASTSYHRLVAELFLSATLLAEQNGHAFSAAYCARLEKMVEFTLHLTRPDGTVPLLGDCDNGRLHRLKAWAGDLREWSDHRHLLAIGAVRFDRADFAAAAGDQWEEAIWLCGAQAANDARAATAATPVTATGVSRAFPDAGIYVLRHEDWQVVICAGPVGQNGNGGHAHNDKLSLTLFAAGQEWLVDPGSYLYTADFAERNHFRSTTYHNTVMVADEEQNRFDRDPGRVFTLHDDARARLVRWADEAAYLLVVAEHEGYRRLAAPVIHRRSFFFDKQAAVWLIQDELVGRRDQNAVTYWHFAPGLVVEPVEGAAAGIQARNGAGQRLNLWVLSPTALTPSVETGWVAPGYGVKVAAPVAIWAWPAAGETTIWACYLGEAGGGQGSPIETSQMRFGQVLSAC